MEGVDSDLEDKVQLVMLHTFGFPGVFNGAEKTVDMSLTPNFFLDLSRKRPLGRFSETDVTAWKECVGGFLLLCQEDIACRDAHPSC